MFSVVNNERDEVLLINKNLKDLTCFVNTDSSIIIGRLCGNKDKSISNSLSVEKNRVGDFINVKITEFGNNEYHSVFINRLH